MGSLPACQARAAEVYIELQPYVQPAGLLADFELGTRPKGEHVFRLRVPEKSDLWQTHRVRQVSVAVPPDAMGNREDEVDEANPPSAIEILLMDADMNTVQHPLIRADVERFGSTEELAIGLCRLDKGESPDGRLSAFLDLLCKADASPKEEEEMEE